MSSTLDRVQSPETNEFSYRPVPVFVPAAMITGILSIVVGIFTEFALPVALIGLVFGVIGQRQVSRSNGEFSGSGIAKAGIVLCVMSLFGGSAWHSYLYATEVPDGFERKSFVRDISKKGFVFDEGASDYHREVRDLDGRKLFLKGYMYPDGRVVDIRNFILCKDSGDCCFGGNPALTDMIEVVIPEGAEPATYTSGLVSVAGTFKLRDLRGAGDMKPAFELEATFFNRAKSLY